MESDGQTSGYRGTYYYSRSSCSNWPGGHEWGVTSLRPHPNVTVAYPCSRVIGPNIAREAI